jgi:pimeloyl-ACP methyl ester carboxylesterase
MTSREPGLQISNPFGALQEYWLDAWQRGILTLDVLHERGISYEARAAATAPNVLTFDAELIIDGGTLQRPVNYALMRIVPPAEVTIDMAKRPFVVFDPRAGHGPGIGGMKHDSEIGVALRAGHPCYFVGFTPTPIPGQTIADVCAAEAHFLEQVIARHPDSDKPALIGNCQAGWQIMMMSALHPDLPGPIILAGSPLSYWAGERGKAPMRYLGGLLGGTWLTALAGDLGNGIFDGANLVANFEGMHPSNTLWKKPHDLYAKVDTEAARFLEFEKWWGNPVLLNAGEMQSIADDLFVGNKLTSGELYTKDGIGVDLREIRSPIVVFCSHGDDITPPPQALQWVLDLYGSDQEIIANGQTIIYCLHQSIGHLGIFVSGKVATREHDEFALSMDLIDVTPPGLYEAVISGIDESLANPDLVTGKYLFQLEKRGLDDLRAICRPNAADDRCFEAAAQVSRANLALYRMMLAPVVQAVASAPVAALMREWHPNRLRFSAFSDSNPLMPPVASLAEIVRQNRQTASPDNPFSSMERFVSASIEQNLEVWAKWRDMIQEEIFFGVYGSPILQALAGLDSNRHQEGRRSQRELARVAREARFADTLAQKIETGGLVEAGIRAMLYVRLSEGRVDERAFAALKQIAAERAGASMSLAKFKEVLREQYLLLHYHEVAAMAALPKLLPADAAQRSALLDVVRRVVTARGSLPPEGAIRLREVEALLDTTGSKRSAA